MTAECAGLMATPVCKVLHCTSVDVAVVVAMVVLQDKFKDFLI